MKSTARHWDKIYSKTEDIKLGWYEKDASGTFKLLREIPHWEKATVFLPGAGTSILIDALLSKGVKLILNDISEKALGLVRERLQGENQGIEWLCQDIARPITKSLPQVDIWIDRAVLHFLTKELDIKGYFRNLNTVLKIGGHALFGEFSMTGAKKCAGLRLHRYSTDELLKYLGASFETVSSFDYTYINPFGDPRPYVYVLFKRIK